MLADDDGHSVEMIHELCTVVRKSGGDAVDFWSYLFPTFDHASTASHAIRQLGLAFDDVTIVAVDSRTGHALSQ